MACLRDAEDVAEELALGPAVLVRPGLEDVQEAADVHPAHAAGLI